MKEDTGNGAQARAGADAQNTVENSSPSRAERRGRKRTGGASPDARDRLEIFQQAAVDLAQFGIIVTVTASNASNAGVVLAIQGVRWCPRCQYLRLEAEMNGDICQYCQLTTREEVMLPNLDTA